MTIDDFLKQIRDDEDTDREVIYGHMTPIEYARSRHIAPQRVYYYIRNGKITYEPCGECGRRVISVSNANEVFAPQEGEPRGDISESKARDGSEGHGLVLQGELSEVDQME